MIDCPHAARCPGCALIALPQAAQLDAKALRLATALAPYATLGAPAPESVRAANPDFGYRTRAKLAVAAGGRVGLFAAQTHEVIDLPACQVLAPVLARAANAIRELLAAPPAEARSVFRGVLDDLARAGDGTGQAGSLRAIDLREVRDHAGVGVLLTLVVDAPLPSHEELETACNALAAAIPELRVIALSLHDGRSPQLLGRAPIALRGELLHPDRTSADEPFHYASPGSFAQAHRAQAAAIMSEVVRALAPGPERRVLDVFAGSGAVGLALAARGADVTLVESFAPAAQAALQAAKQQALHDRLNIRIGYAEKELPRLVMEGARFDAAVVNPPRRGLAPRAREALTNLCTGPLVYVSCEPETLARDLSHLSESGWRTIQLTPFDLMPQTREVECVAVLERRALPQPTVLYEDDELLAVAKPPFLATIPHREREDSLLARVREIAPLAVPLHRLDADTSGVCLFTKRAEVVAAWQATFAGPDAHKHYLALVRGQVREKGRIARPIVERGRERAAVTRYRLLEKLAGHALLEITPESGRTHQIRRHLASIGHPVLGDERYGHTASNRHLVERYWLDRPFLHCASFSFAHPRTSTPLQIEAPLSPDLACVLERLRAACTPAPTSGRHARKKSRSARAARAKSSGRSKSETTR